MDNWKNYTNLEGFLKKKKHWIVRSKKKKKQFATLFVCFFYFQVSCLNFLFQAEGVNNSFFLPEMWRKWNLLESPTFDLELFSTLVFVTVKHECNKYKLCHKMWKLSQCIMLHNDVTAIWFGPIFLLFTWRHQSS